MIFRLDTSLINKSYARELASCLKLIHEKKHKVDYNNPSVWDFIEQEVLTTQYLGKDDIDIIKENQDMRDVRISDRNYYRTIDVGLKSGMSDMKNL